MKIYAIYDQKAKKVAPAFCSENDATAVRNFAMAMKNVVVGREDFDLLDLGFEYNDTDTVGVVISNGGNIQ